MIHFQLLKQFKDVAEQAGIYFCQLNLNESGKIGYGTDISRDFVQAEIRINYDNK